MSKKKREGEEVQPLQKGKGRILMVDDEVDIVNAAKIILEQTGYEVLTFTNSPRGLAQPFKLIRTDLICLSPT